MRFLKNFAENKLTNVQIHTLLQHYRGISDSEEMCREEGYRRYDKKMLC